MPKKPASSNHDPNPDPAKKSGRKPKVLTGELIPAGQPGTPGRPSEFDPVIADRIIERLNEGKSFNWFLSDEAEGYPAKSTISRWRANNKEFDARCARACEAAADADYDRMEEIEALVLAGKMDPKAANVALSNMRWRMEKRKSRSYGQRVEVEHSGKVGLEQLVAGVGEAVDE